MNRRETAVTEQDVYKNVLRIAGWALPKPFLYLVSDAWSTRYRVPSAGVASLM